MQREDSDKVTEDIHKENINKTIAPTKRIAGYAGKTYAGYAIKELTKPGGRLGGSKLKDLVEKFTH